MNTFTFSLTTGLAVGLACATTVHAQSTMTVDTTALKPASVTGGFSDVTPGLAPRALVVLGAEEATQTGAPSLADVLETVPGIDVRSRGPFGIQTDLSIRGGTFEQTALWVDGVRWSAPHTGHHLMDLPVDPEDLTRVEVFRGGASSALGTGAMTGAVALTAGPSTKDGTLLVAESGSNAWMRAKVTHDFGSDVARHRIAVSRMGTNGTLGSNTNTDASILRARYAGWLGGDWGTLRTSVGYAGKAFGALNFYTSSFPYQYEETQTIQGQAVYSKSIDNLSFEAAIHHRTHVDEFQLYREHNDYYVETDDGFLVFGADTAASWYTAPNNHISHTSGGRLLARYASMLGETFVSADVRREFIKSNRLGVERHGDEDESSVYQLGDSRLNADVALGHRAELGSLALSMTAAWNINSMFGTRFVPGAELSLDMAGDGSSILFASANRSVRHPSYTDLYYNIGGAQGSLDLNPEWADHLEAGLRVRLADGKYAVQLEQLIFRRQGQNLIDWATPNGESTTYAINLREVTFSGLETVVNVIPKRSTNSPGQARYARFGFTTMEASESSEGFESNYVLDGLKTKIDASFGVNLDLGLLLDVRYSYQDRLGGFIGAESDEEEEYEPFSLLSFTLSRHFANEAFRAYVRVDNALDLNYVDLGNIEQPGRWVRLGVAYQMN